MRSFPPTPRGMCDSAVLYPGFNGLFQYEIWGKKNLPFLKTDLLDLSLS